MAIRTLRRQVQFASPFTLRPIDGTLPPGSYDVEVDEEELVGMHKSGFVRVATLFTVERDGMSRVYTVQAADLDAALIKDGQSALQR
jgi:hypothetical protein